MSEPTRLSSLRGQFSEMVSYAAAKRMDVLCEEFERLWQHGNHPQLSEYLARWSEPVGRRELFRELLSVELACRRAKGEQPSREEYEQQFPDYADVVARLVDFLPPAEHGSVSVDAEDSFSTVSRAQDQHDTDHRTPAEVAANDQAPTAPERIGRYRLQRLLGQGAFGRVFLAHDDELDRAVAIKVPHGQRVKTAQDVESYLREARLVAGLDHPAIVPVYDAGRLGDGRCFVVSKYVEGTNLEGSFQDRRPAYCEATRLLAAIAQALHYAHRQGIVHRDVKPANILLDPAGKPYLADFGLALKEEDFGCGPEIAGTPLYMSPEQARGEGHLVDGRSDIFSLGAVLYWLLCGRQPFRAATVRELLKQISNVDVRPPRQIDDCIPSELERICLKALARRATDRYTTAKDLADDLEHFAARGEQFVDRSGAAGVATIAARAGPVHIVPKGLRSFDTRDADFFLELLPGPRDRNGLPDSIRFWKDRIEETDQEETFRVGLLYGPSGCGKSSLVKAGLLPSLADHVVRVYVEAVPQETESRLLAGLRSKCLDPLRNHDLQETLAALRRGRGIPMGSKVLIVLDQFEQWLHAHGAEQHTDLAAALRQCDGGRVQALLMVRDDFWVSACRLMQQLEVRVVEGHNAALVDLFDPLHARKVLAEFGRAYGRLPENLGHLTPAEAAFLDEATSGLAEEGKVVCVRLSLFAEMMKGRKWTPTSLHEVGGTSGVGVTFLEETFNSRTAPPEHRRHEQAARGVLTALLPECGTDIKGGMKSSEQLREASGYIARAADFADLTRILDREIRLITPTTPEGESPSDDAPATGKTRPQYYQLTHDYLVPSLREWLTNKQKRTRRGRAELRLAERAVLWNAKPERQQLPSFWEFSTIRLLTGRRKWNEPQRQMMKAATRHYGFLASCGFAMMLVAIVTLQWFLIGQQRRMIGGKVDALQSTMGAGVPYAIRDLEELSKTKVVRELRHRFDDPSMDRRLPLAFGLAKFERPDCPFLVKAIASARAEECDNLVTALGYAGEDALRELRSAAAAATSKKDWILKTRLATIAMYLGDTAIAAEMLRAEPPWAEQSPSRAEAWNDVPLDSKWTEPDAATISAVEAAHGIIADRFAFCQDMPWDTFLATVEALRPSGYRPTRVRPFVHNDQRLVAGVWTRDNQRWQLDKDLAATDLPPPESNADKNGLVPADVAAYRGAGKATLYCVLWSQPESEHERRRLCVNMTVDGWSQAEARMIQVGLTNELTLQASVDADGSRRHAGIWSNQGEQPIANPAFSPPFDRTDQWAWKDISIAGVGVWPHPLDVLRERLTALEQLPFARQIAADVRMSRAVAHYYLNRPEDALVDLDILVSESSALPAEVLLYFAACRAQLGKEEEARSAVAKLLGDFQGSGYDALGQILTHAWLGDAEEAERILNEFAKNDEQDPTTVYKAACAAAQLARIPSQGDPARIAAWKRRAIELIARAYSLNRGVSMSIATEPGFAPLYDVQDFQSLLLQLTTEASWAGVWMYRDASQFEPWLDAEGSPESQQRAAPQRAVEHFRPAAVAVTEVPDKTELRSVVVWHRPFLKWDPIQRTVFIEHFPEWSGDLRKLAGVLGSADDASLRSGISLAVGGVEKPSPEAQTAWEDVFSVWHRDRPDSGTHSATGWALRTWGLPLPEAGSGPPKQEVFGWQVTKSGLTLIRIPAGEVDSPDEWERRRRIRITRDFWLSDREVTQGLFEQFLKDPDAERPDFSREISEYWSGHPSLQACSVSWYDAVLFCNWLSRQEGRGLCYQKEGKEKIRDYGGKITTYDAWKVISDANGYRLPTEAEWEYACRARTTTTYAFGDADEMLDRYAVFANNSKDKPGFVGQKHCNAWGLFDMHGNFQEWCQDWYEEGSDRVIRGGSFSATAEYCRSASRYGGGPTDRHAFVGFRVALGPSADPSQPAGGVENGKQ